MLKSSITLMRCIYAYVAIKLFVYDSLVKLDPSWQELFIFVTCCLFVWQVLVVHSRFKSQSSLDQQVSLEWLRSDDLVGLFLILCVAHNPLASQYLWGFWAFTCVALTLLALLLFNASIEFYARKSATPRLIGCLFFAFCLLLWGKNAYVYHYGVPIVGHFLEKPEYDAKYRISMEPENSNKRFEAIADIHVEGRTETEDNGDVDWSDMPIINTYTYRDVWIRRIYFPNGGSFQPQDHYCPNVFEMRRITFCCCWI